MNEQDRQTVAVEAQRRGISSSGLVRRAVRQFLDLSKVWAPGAGDVLTIRHPDGRTTTFKPQVNIRWDDPYLSENENFSTSSEDK